MWLTIIFLSTVALALIVTIMGAARWQDKTQELHAQLEAGSLPNTPSIYDAREIESLPLPVRRYFRTVLRDGQPIITGLRVIQHGQLRQSEAANSWRPFQATEVLTTWRPGFIWNARIKMLPGLDVLVQDAYVAGTGSLRASLLGFVTVAEMGGTPEMAQGELLRYLAEAAWYPTALLPSQGVCWEAKDESLARATLTDGDTSVWMEFHFDKEGLITTAWTPARYRAVNGILEATPWQGRFSHYEERAGMTIPLQGEVEWLLPTGPFLCWRGCITDIEYELASSPKIK